MLVDNTSSSANEYLFSIIQYNNISTLESYNVGIIIKNSDRNILIHIPTIDASVETCIDIKDRPAFTYNLKMIQETIENTGTIFEGNISDALNISIFRPLTTDLNIEDAINMLIEEYLSLKKLRIINKEHKKSTYDKRNIMNLMSSYASKNNIKNFIAHKHFKKLAYKPIDMSLLNNDGQPYSIATIASPHLDSFQDSFIANIFTLQEATRNGNIQKSFLHIPVFGNLKDVNIAKNVGWAKEQAKHYQLETLQDPREKAVFEMLQS